MATHAPHVRTKKPLRGRQGARDAHKSHRLAPLRHAAGTHKLAFGRVRRGPATGERPEPSELGFHVGALGVVLAAAVLGVALGLAQPSWMLAAALVAAGALLATMVAFMSGARGPETQTS